MKYVLGALALIATLALSGAFILRSDVNSLQGQVKTLAAQERTLEREVHALEQQPAAITTSSPAPLASWQDMNTTTCSAALILRDPLQSPIWWVLNCGGMWVGNDKLGVTGHNVTDQAIYMYSPDGVHGALVIDGLQLDGHGLAFLLCIEHQPLSACRAGL